MGFDQHSTPSSAMDSQASTATAAGVSNCFVFKSRLQEYAQKAGLSTPVYETIKEGPSHEPTFRSTVIVNDFRYDSLPGFFNRKAAEQSAAEVALRKMAQSGEMKERVSQPVHESGLCKNLLQEYAQKMNYAMPLYECRKDEAPGRGTLFSCTVEIGEIKYIGGSARTKKEAEIKAARTALLAIESSASDSEAYDKLIENTEYTVFPFKKKPTNSGMSVQETAAVLKPKKRRLKKKPNKKKRSANGANHVKGKYTNGLKANMDMPPGTDTSQFDSIGALVTDSGFQLTEASNNFQYGSENKENALVENKENASVFSNNGDSPLSVLKDGDSKDVDQNVFQNSVI